MTLLCDPCMKHWQRKAACTATAASETSAQGSFLVLDLPRPVPACSCASWCPRRGGSAFCEWWKNHNMFLAGGPCFLPGVTDRGPTPPARAAGKLSTVHDGRDRDTRSTVLAQLSAPVLELITPDGCASSSASDMSSLIRNIQRAVAGGVSLVQLRDCESDAKSKAEIAVRLFAATKGSALLVVNGDP